MVARLVEAVVAHFTVLLSFFPGFLFNLFADPDIIRLPSFLSPLQKVIAAGISKRRAPKSRAAYESIGGGSPILKYSNAQANLLRESLQQRHGLKVKTYIGMRYWHPFTEEALEQIRDLQLDGKIASRDEALEMVERILATDD